MFNIFLQLCLAALCSAAPLSTNSSNATQYGTGGGIVGFIVLVLDILVWSTCPAAIPSSNTHAYADTLHHNS